VVREAGYEFEIIAIGHERRHQRDDGDDDQPPAGNGGSFSALDQRGGARLPPEEGGEFFEACRDAGIDPVLLAAPTTTPERMERLARETRGFLYYVSLTGVTGARSELAQGIETGVRAAQAASGVPVCVGFGISTPAQASQVCRYADGAVVGSAIVERIEQAESRDDAVDVVARFVAELKAPLREPR